MNTTGILVSSQLRTNASLELGSKARLIRIEKPLRDAGKIVLKPTTEVNFQLDEALSILAKEILSMWV
jgi:hypothetical protein